jgi:hypothetical protein
MRPSPYAIAANYAVILAALSGLPQQALAADLAATCPAKIPASSFVPGIPPEGWTAFVPRPMHLTGAGMMAGPPEALEYLVPNKEDGRTQVFDFQKGDRQRWLWCAYAGGVQISRRLADEAIKCTVTHTSDKQGSISRAAVACVTR